VTRHPNAGSIGDQDPDIVICSRECLQAFAAQTSGPDRALTEGPRGPGKPGSHQS
jgi:hypothetical protein